METSFEKEQLFFYKNIFIRKKYFLSMNKHIDLDDIVADQSHYYE